MNSLVLNLGALTVAIAIALGAAGCGGGRPPPSSTPPAGDEITVTGVDPANGVFDPAPTVDGSATLWMSFSIVEPSAVDPVLAHVSTRIARSDDGGLSWQDAGVAPNTASTFKVPNDTTADPNDTFNATWQYEVSHLIYDAQDSDAARRWKILWHRYLAVDVNGVRVPLFEHGWIGMKAAPAPDGPWSTERKLFVGTLYDSGANDSTLGPPEFDLPGLFPGNDKLGLCAAFSEPGVLVKGDDIYISMLCGAGAAGKTVLVRCDHAFGHCDYLGDFLQNSEAAQFENPGQNFEGFSASEMFSVGNTDYLMVTPNTPSEDRYRGCLVFEINDLANAALQRQGGVPVLVDRIEGEAGSFRGACGYHPALSASGVLLSQFTTSVPNFHIVATGVQLP